MWKRIKTYVELTKPFNNSKSTLYYGFCTFIGTLLAFSYDVRLWPSLKAAISITLSAFAVYALNDIYDIEIDRINAPERPLPSGRITINEAFALSFVLLIISLSIASTINLTTFFFTLLFSILGIIYSTPPLRLKDGLYGNICWGLGLGSTILCGASIATLTLRPVIVALGLFFLTAGCAFTKDLKDLEGDRALNMRTFPIIIGEKRTIILMTIMAAAGFPIFLLDFLLYGINIYYLMIIMLSVLSFSYSLIPLYNHTGSRMIYNKAYKIQSVSGFILIIAFILISLT